MARDLIVVERVGSPSADAFEAAMNAALAPLLSQLVGAFEITVTDKLPASTRLIKGLVDVATGGTVITNPYKVKAFEAVDDVTAVYLAEAFMAANPAYWFSPVLYRYSDQVPGIPSRSLIFVLYNESAADGAANWDPGYAGGGGGGNVNSVGWIGTNVKNAPFNATGDGVTLDTPAIQAAVDYVFNTRGGGVVFLPAGDYLVNIAQTGDPLFKHALTMRPGVSLVGESRERTTIKLADNQGNYMSILSRALISDRDMDDVELRDLCIDQNNAGNVPAALADLTNPGCSRIAFCCFGGHNIAVRNCWFKNYKSVNTIVLNAPIGDCVDVQVTNNWFDHAVSNSVANDHSAIYTSASEVVIEGNQFRAPTQNTFGAVTAIETHGSQHVVNSNTVHNYMIGAITTGIAAASDNVIVTNNVIEGGRYGVVLWAHFGFGNTTQPALTNCRVSGNTIRMDRDPWTQSTPISHGIFMEQTGTAPTRSIEISNNLIYWKTPTVVTNPSDIYSVGIGWDRPLIEQTQGGLAGWDQDLKMVNNIIVNAPANGIRVKASIKSLTISDNTIRNCGQSQEPTFFPASRAAVFAFTVTGGIRENWYVHHNEFVDDQSTPTMTMGLVTDAEQAVDCRFEDNVWAVQPGHTYPVYSGTVTAGAAWYVRHTCNAYTVPLVGSTKAGSSILETDTGTTQVQVTTPQGFVYASTVATAYPPNEVLYGKADGSGASVSNPDLRFSPIGEATVIVGGTLPGSMWLNGAAGDSKSLYWMAAGVRRFGWLGDSTTLAAVTFNDDGSFRDSPIDIPRLAASPVSFNRDVNVFTTKAYYHGGIRVVNNRKLGWGAPTGARSRLTFDTATVTTQQLAEHFAALYDDLAETVGHGLVGA